MQRRLHQIHSSVDDHSQHIKELQSHFAHLEQDLKVRAHRENSRPAALQPDEVLMPLKQELHHRRQQGDEMDAMLSETQREMQAAEERLRVLLNSINQFL